MLSCIWFIFVEKSYEFSFDALCCSSRDLCIELAKSGKRSPRDKPVER
jgi:hypothetical protein